MTNQEMKNVEQIRRQYEQTTQEKTAFDQLKELDRKVKLPTEIFGYTFGSVGALVLGTGMTMAMGLIGGGMVIGIAIGVVGIVMMSINYPIYQKILKSRKNKYAKQIFALSDLLMHKKGE